MADRTSPASVSRPDDIDVVVNSHLHPDHCGCNDFFKQARRSSSTPRRLKRRTRQRPRRPAIFAHDWDHPVPIDAIAGEHDVFGDGRIVLVPLPGHTPGTIGALVVLDSSGAFLLASDTVSLRATIDTDIIPRNTWNADALKKSLAEVDRIEKSGAQP